MNLSNEIIEKLKQGEFGVTRDGRKALYAGTDSDNEHVWLLFTDSNPKMPEDFEVGYYTFNIYNQNNLSRHDIVGLWKDKPEPFNLERALAGEPLINKKTELKCWLHKSRKSDDYFIEFEDGGINHFSENSLNTRFEMWKEPEPAKPNTDDLPKPIKDFGNLTEVWFLKLADDKNQYMPNNVVKGLLWSDREHTRLKNGFYYATEEDCQKICDWLINR